MRRLKILLIYCLCVTILVTSGTGAFARGQMAFGQTLEICAQGAPALIRVNADGNPADAGHLCPECLAATAGMPPALPEFAQFLASGRWIALPPVMVPAHQYPQNLRARGPPVMI